MGARRRHHRRPVLLNPVNVGLVACASSIDRRTILLTHKRVIIPPLIEYSIFRDVIVTTPRNDGHRRINNLRRAALLHGKQKRRRVSRILINILVYARHSCDAQIIVSRIFIPPIKALNGRRRGRARIRRQ